VQKYLDLLETVKMARFQTSIGAALGITLALAQPVVAQSKPCPGNASALGVSRTVEIDTTNGPGFGFEHYKAHDFLQMKEVVLTFDDGPQKIHTEAILQALAAHCTKATFFSIGKMALGYPEIIRRVAAEGHTVGTHTWSHKDLRKEAVGKVGIEEFERGVSAVRRAVGGPIAPFFRYPKLLDSPESLAHLQSRNHAVFSTDIDSFDFKFRSGEQLAKAVVAKLDKRGKGIVLMHDIQPGTSKGIAQLLNELQAGGYKIVHMKAKAEAKTVPEFDAMIEKDVKGLPGGGSERPTAAVVRTVDDSAKPSPVNAAVPVKK
jgi:peptidoglycan-N-acetylglucosamine deacetylase